MPSLGSSGAPTYPSWAYTRPRPLPSLADWILCKPWDPPTSSCPHFSWLSTSSSRALRLDVNILFRFQRSHRQGARFQCPQMRRQGQQTQSLQTEVLSSPTPGGWRSRSKAQADPMSRGPQFLYITFHYTSLSGNEQICLEFLF